jgi:hypothetical protein
MSKCMVKNSIFYISHLSIEHRSGERGHGHIDTIYGPVRHWSMNCRH